MLRAILNLPPKATKAAPIRTIDEQAEWDKCRADKAYFVANHCPIFNATSKRWVRFNLWQAQADVLEYFTEYNYLIALKARQLGFTWLTLAHFLHEMIFHPAATVLIFSKRDEEATSLLSERLVEMHARLPVWMQEPVAESNNHSFVLGNGSSAKAFPTTGGRSYTGSHVMLDEADFMPKLGRVLNAVQPTIDAGGQIIIISTTDKEQPESTFKTMFKAAQNGETEYYPIFLPWYARPTRTMDWYQKRVADSLAQTGSMDVVYQEYPATVEQALMPNTTDKRIPPQWLAKVYAPAPALTVGPAINGLVIYHSVEIGKAYVIGADPAEGNPQSDDSAATVVELDTGIECAKLRGKFEPSTFAQDLDKLARFYNMAGVMVERNNHGHTVLLALYHLSEDKVQKVIRLYGKDKKPGWLSSTVGKVAMYDEMADFVNENQKSGTIVLHSDDTMLQLSSITGSDLRAPEGQLDDLADSAALAQVGRAALQRVLDALRGDNRQSISVMSMS